MINIMQIMQNLKHFNFSKIFRFSNQTKINKHKSKKILQFEAFLTLLEAFLKKKNRIYTLKY